ncbi:MAG: 2,3-bisphosphoglycerate-independent phosphoglycerate mutase [bacterium]|nr:2,3-bisphosphoglycerate-independent phosphoglycerate mutase [bacterium]
MKKTVLLVILDGWGVGAKNSTNPVYSENPPHIRYLKENYPSGTLQASGIAVGLPWDEEGNSEVGHLTMGSGKVIYQHFPKITIAIRKGEFAANKVLLTALAHTKENKSALNLVGILTDGNVHASLEHLKALIEVAEKEGIPRINLHLFADGKDSPPRSFLTLLKKIPMEYLASISGRYYAMDRDMHFERTQATYLVLTSESQPVPDYEAVVNGYFQKGLPEEFIEPMLVGSVNHGIKDGDSVIFFNFREDSIRQLAGAFIDTSFDHFARKTFQNLYLATMTTYSDKFNVPVLFPTETIDMPLVKVLSDNGKMQLRIAETEKYAHVTFFFNGYKDPPFPNEYRILVPSKNVPKHDEHPEMMAKEITDRAVAALEEGAFDFIMVNFANADIIAHTGNYDAAIKAIQILDNCVGILTEKILATGGTMIVTADHGNIEQMRDPYTFKPETKHNVSPVPIYLVAKEYARTVSDAEIEDRETSTIGILSDIAPTILEIMKLPKPEEMTGESLLRTLL